MERTVNCLSARIGSADIVRRFRGQPMPDVRSAINGWSLSEKERTHDFCLCLQAIKKDGGLEARRKREAKYVSRTRMSARYMKQQQKEAEQPLNNAFAEALAKMKF